MANDESLSSITTTNRNWNLNPLGISFFVPEDSTYSLTARVSYDMFTTRSLLTDIVSHTISFSSPTLTSSRTVNNEGQFFLTTRVVGISLHVTQSIRSNAVVANSSAFLSESTGTASIQETSQVSNLISARMTSESTFSFYDFLLSDNSEVSTSVASGSNNYGSSVATPITRSLFKEVCETNVSFPTTKISHTTSSLPYISSRHYSSHFTKTNNCDY